MIDIVQPLVCCSESRCFGLGCNLLKSYDRLFVVIGNSIASPFLRNNGVICALYCVELVGKRKQTVYVVLLNGGQI